MTPAPPLTMILTQSSGVPMQWDAGSVAAAIAGATGVHLVVEGPCPDGQVGAAYVRWPDGHRAVLSWRPGAWSAEERGGPRAVAAVRRAIGSPRPPTELVVPLSRGVALVQELLPGVPPQHADEPL